MPNDYIPSQIADKALWLDNFDTKLTSAPATYGLTAPDAAIVAAAVTAFQAAYAVSINPATRTSASIAATNGSLAVAIATVRPYAVRIAANPSVTDLNKVSIGVTLRSTVRTPVPAPTTQPSLALLSAVALQHQLRYNDVTTPATKAKPFGATGMELAVAVGVVAAVDPLQATYRGTYTKSPLFVDFVAGDRGKIATYFGRWVTTAGPGGVAQKGPWSSPSSFTVV